MFKAAALCFISSVVFTESALRGSSDNHRELVGGQPIVGECTVEVFASVVGSSTLASYLGTSNNNADMQAVLDTKCAAALTPTIDLSETTGKGPQFLKNFFDGGTTWNDNHEENGSYVLSKDASVINTVYKNDVKTSVFASPDGGTSAHYPRYFSNFYTGEHECPLGVIQCCYTDTRASSPFNGKNADICALDMTLARKSNHITARSMTYYDTNPGNQAYCSGFAYEKDSFGDSVKYNTLFHMAMKNLYKKNLVKNIPGAPLCGCVEQMPIVDNSDCVKAVEGYTIDSSGNVGVNISWEDCDTDLASYYSSLARTQTEKYFVNSMIVGSGQCAAAAKTFMNDQMLVKS